MVIDPHMAVIQVQMGKNLVEDLLLDGRFGMNIMTKELQKWLKFLSLKPTSYTFWMVDQIITKPIGLIKDLKIHIHGIPYIVTFIVMKNNVLDSSCSMLRGQPWLHNPHVTHDWGNNLITIESNGMVQTIVVTKHSDSNTKYLEVLLCYDMMEGVTNEEEEILFATKSNLFTLGTITLLELKIFNATIFGAKVNTKDLKYV